MKAQPFVVTPKDCDPALNVLGTKVTVLASNAATQAYEITLQQGDEGMGPPPHSHNWDESFYVLKGKVEFTCAGKTIMCMPGTLVHVPAGTVHGFRYGAAAARCSNSPARAALPHRCSLPSTRRSPPAPLTFPRCWRCSSKTG